MSSKKKHGKIAQKPQASHLQKIKSRSTGDLGSGDAGDRSRSNSRSSRHSPAEARIDSDEKKKKHQEETSTSREHKTKEVHILCEKIDQQVRTIKKEVVDDNPSEVMEVNAGVTKTPGSPNKRRREETPSLESDDDDRLREIAAITDDVRKILLDDSFEIPLNIINAVLTKCSMYERLLQRQLLVSAKLEGKILALNEASAEAKAECDRAKEAHDSTTETNVNRTFALVVKGTRNEKPKRIKEKVKEAAKDARVTKCKELSNGQGIVLITKDEDETKRLANKIKVNRRTKDFKVEERSLRNPRLVMYNVDDMYEEKDILEEIHQRNLEGQGSIEEIKQKIKIIGTRKCARFDDARHVIFDIVPEYCKKIIKNGGIYMDLEVFKVALWEEVPRCYNCHQYDHFAKDCKNKKLCWKCCGPDHLAADCKEKENCINCKKKALPADHAATSSCCPEYEWRLEMLRARTKPI